ncbi:DUF504 domain-containing protein [Aspergillus melleus]|uniref:DUF504 domain-containing protein n=1 Tax=Aspergillus melleus TaxID=138277 RepID=UPI001E8CC177|nr:uncharacterized protein LDX57_011172 [Aspergillus melleus]KAH8433537.1 hypothetical protein LDX57_011172 [Aspergillus melleus]
MASGVPTLASEEALDRDLAVRDLQDNETTAQEEKHAPIETPQHVTSSTQTPASMENRLRPATDIINRIIWDSNYDSANYIIGYEDRFEGRLEVGIGSWKRESTDEEFIPQHRVLYIKRKSDGEIMWDRRRRIDKVFLSGNSAFDFLAFLS